VGTPATRASRKWERPEEFGYDCSIYTPGGVRDFRFRSCDLLSTTCRAALIVECEGSLCPHCDLAVLFPDGIDADPMKSREVISCSRRCSIRHGSNRQRSSGYVDPAGSIPSGDASDWFLAVLDLESILSAKDRFQLAMILISLIASPGFESWLEGEALDIVIWLHTAEEGRAFDPVRFRTCQIPSACSS